MDSWLFIHVMKTAGTSFRLMLENEISDKIYPTRQELRELPNGWYLSTPDLLAQIADGRLDLTRRKVISGHYPAALADHLPGKWRTAIFLREPISRTLSRIAFKHRERNRSRVRRLLDLRGLRVSDYLRDDWLIATQIRDYQTKVLALDGNADVHHPREVDRAAFERARQRVESMDFVGITEEFEDSVKVFQKLSGIEFDQSALHVNKSATYEAEGVDLDGLREVLRYDIELYELAKQKLHSQLSTLT